MLGLSCFTNEHNCHSYRMIYKLRLINLGKCTWECDCKCVCVLTGTRREFAAVSPGGWWNKKKFVQLGAWTQVWKELESKEDIIGHIQNGYFFVAVGCSLFALLSSTHFPLSQLLVLVLKVSSEFCWTMKTISAVQLAIPSPFPSHPLPEKQDVLESTSEMCKGTQRLLKLTKKISSTECLVHKTMRAYMMHHLNKPPTDGWLTSTIVGIWVVKIPGGQYADHRTTNHFPLYCSLYDVFSSAFINFQKLSLWPCIAEASHTQIFF